MKYRTGLAWAFLATAGTLFAGDGTEPYQASRVEARLNLTVKEDTQVLHFVRDNVDPDIVTKTYVLKHADPYEIRRYLREIVQTRMVDESDSGIQAIKYNDGTGIVMVSAEDYRFEDSENGQGIDSIVAMLDKPGVVSMTGQSVYIYNPLYRPARELRAMVRAAGADVSEDATENTGGSDRISCDDALNLMLFKTTQFSRKNIENVLKEYDRIYPEIKAKITVYELDAENDAKLGLDFQAWKNNDGIDLFNTGGRFLKNYNPGTFTLAKNAGWSDVKYLNFNPKWNTKYIDFLTSKGKAKVVQTCEVAVRHGATAEIEHTGQVFLPKTTPAENTEYMEEYLQLKDVVPGTDFELNARTGNGKEIAIEPTDPAEKKVTLSILKAAPPSPEDGTKVRPEYRLRITGGIFTVDGVKAGHKIKASFVEVTDLSDPANPEVMELESANFAAQKGNIVTTEPSGEYGFRMEITPSVTEKAAMLHINVSNSSLIGYTSDGSPRIQQGAEVTSDFMISNAGTKLVIGGLEKRSSVSVSGGIPLLKDLPLLGWIFSTESESTKRSQLLVVAEVIPVRPETPVDAGAAKEISGINGKLKNAGETNRIGYRQILLDPERLK